MQLHSWAKLDPPSDDPDGSFGQLGGLPQALPPLFDPEHARIAVIAIAAAGTSARKFMPSYLPKGPDGLLQGSTRASCASAGRQVRLVRIVRVAMRLRCAPRRGPSVARRAGMRWSRGIVVGCGLLAACGQAGGGSQPAGGDDSGAALDAGAGEASVTDAARAGDAATDGSKDAGPAPLCLPHYATGAPASASACPPAPSSPDTLDALLGSVGLTRCFQLPSWENLFPDLPGDFRMAWFDAIHDRPMWVPSFARSLAADLDAASVSTRPVSQLIAVAEARLGATIAACDPGPALGPTPGDTAPFAHAVEALVASAGGTPSKATLESQASAIPEALQEALVPIVNLLAQSAAAQKKYLGAHASEASQLALMPYVGLPNGAYPSLGDAAFQQAVAALDLSVMATYAAQLTVAIESADLPRFAGTKGFALSAQTPLGAIVIGDASAHTYLPSDPDLGENILLLVDTGGDDTYRIPVGATTHQPASVAIDLAGDDQYLYVEVPVPSDTGLLPSDGAGRLPPQQGYGPASLSTALRQGSGVLGVGLLYDLGGGKDHYRSLRGSQGFGTFGVGALYDDGGDDVYEGEAAVQGSATFGLGILLDAGGDDRRSTFTLSQGYAFTGGFGLLQDLGGNDQYLADVGDPASGGTPIYYSPQLPGAGNSTLSQGCGEGMRDDTNGLYWSGGVGVLRDTSGADAYTGSVFAQGTGYWFGVGLLLDGAGADRYDALWYTQGSAAHAAIGVLWDGAGDDLYEQMLTPKSGNLGTGHDFGEGFLIDMAGNDRMTGGGLSLGEGNDDGLGLLVDVGGTDSFQGTMGTATLDTSGTGGAARPTYGLFVKAGGAGDSYDGQTDRSGTTWRNPSGADAGTLVGAGVDQPDGSVDLTGSGDAGTSP
jgi:hypothetical protein